MKYLRKFSVFESGDNLDDETRDIFGIWTYLKLVGPIVVDMSYDYFLKLDWDRGDEIDRPDDHVIIYSIESEDDDGFVWGASQDIIDGHIEGDINIDDLEIIEGWDFFTDQIKHAFEERGFNFLFDNKSQTSAKTDVSWEEVSSIFSESLEYSGTGKKGEFFLNGELINPYYTIRFDVKDYKSDNSLSWIYIKNRDGKRIWSLI